MQLRTASGNGEMAARRPGGPPFAGTPPLRGGFPVDYGPRVDDRRQGLTSPTSRPAHNSKDDHEDTPPSRHLWVGNVSQDVSEAMITEKFAHFGEVDNVTVYSTRNYAFVNFRNQNDSVEAKNRLQGFVLGGMAIRIEYAKGAKQSRHLWVGGISPNVTKEQIEGEFRKHGVLEDFKLLRERNCAFVDFANIEDAVGAVEALNRKRFGDEELRVDYGRSQPTKRDIRGDERGGNPREHQGSQDGYHGYQGAGGNLGDGRGKADKDGGPSEVLWVGFPLPSKVDEDALRRAFMPFGEVDRVKTFPGRTYAFVQFQTVEDATRAKNALDGKLFDDPRVHIRYSKSEIGPIDSPREAPLSSSQRVGDRQSYPADILGGPRVPAAQSDRFGSPGRPTPSPTTRLGGGLRPEYRPNALMAGLGLERGSARNSDHGPGLGRVSGRSTRLEDIDYPRGSRPDSRSTFDDAWDLPDADIVPRDSKRLRVYAGGEADAPGFDPRYEQRQHRGSEGGTYTPTAALNSYETGRAPATPDYNQGLGGRPRGGLPIADGSHPLPVGSRPPIGGHASAPGSVPAASVYGKHDIETAKGPEGWQWHGTIAKGGTPVCRARCLPVGKGIDATVPDVVNCTARTDLDMLAKHVYQAGDFGVVFFVPEGDPDVPPYQDFMHYLGEKHRAGVAKLADGTTLFLVPPSEFSEKVLKVPGQNCLFGVVLKFQQPVPAPVTTYNPAAPQQQQPPPLAQHPPSFPPQQQPPPQHVPGPQAQYPQHQTLPPQQHAPPQESNVFQGSHQSLPHNQQPQTGIIPSPGRNETPSNSNNGPMLSQAQLASIAGLPGVLTPELIASLTALLPKVNNSQAPPSTEANSGSTSVSNGLKPFPGSSGMPVGSTPMQGAPPPAGTNPPQSDMRPMFRPPQNNPTSGPPQGWPPHQSQQERPSVGMGSYHSQAPDQGMYTPQPPPQPQPQTQQHNPHPSQQQQQPQQQQSPQMHIPPTHGSGLPPSGPPPTAGQAPTFSGPPQQHQQQGYPGPSGPGIQQFPPLPQMPRPPQQPMGGPQQQMGAPPQLPSDQLAQLTALLTQRQQQPAQQQAAAQLLQQHYQQNNNQPGGQAPGGPPQPHQPQQGLVHQSQPPLQQQQQLPTNGHSQQPHSQPPSYGQYPQSSWGQGPPPQHQAQSPAHGSSQPPSMIQQQQQQLQQPPLQIPASIWENASAQASSADQQGGFQNQSGGDPDAQNKRFQATVQLAAALLQQMQQQQGKAPGGHEQR